jgi:hypothetical protein
MTHHYNADTREDDSIMVLANEQLERELLESQKTPLITCLSSQRVISRNLSWLRERLDTSKCFSRIVSKLVRMNLLC